MTVSAYDADKDGKENRILFWLRHDEWHLCDAALLLIDVNPELINLREKNAFTELITLRGVRYSIFDASIDGFRELQSKYDDLHRILFSPDMEHATPQNWIDRALAKQIAIPWFDFAIKNGFYKSETKSTQAEKPIFDKGSSTYSVELDLAMQAWQAVTSNLGKGKPKAQIRAWLDENTKLSNEAKERISTVANWDKTGGSTRTD